MDYQTGNVRLRQVNWFGSRSAQQTVPNYESLAGCAMFGQEDALARQASPKTPSDKKREFRQYPGAANGGGTPSRFCCAFRIVNVSMLSKRA